MSVVINNPSLLPKNINTLAIQSRQWSPQQWAGYLMALKENNFNVHLFNVMSKISVIKTTHPKLFHLLANVVLGNSLAAITNSKVMLSRRQHQVLEGYFIRGMSNEQIAQRPHLAVGTVYAHKTRAIKKLYYSSGKAYDIIDMASWPLKKIAPHHFPSPEIKRLRVIFCKGSKI